jgi:excisionase family DNA binding protein
MNNQTDPLASLNTLGAAIDAIIKKTVLETVKALQGSNGHTPKLLTVKELARELKISEFSVYEMVRKKQIAVHRIGAKALRFDLQEILASEKKD